VILCPSCGAENSDTAKFCQECGTRLQPLDTVSQVPIAQEVSPQQPDPTPADLSSPESEATATAQVVDPAPESPPASTAATETVKPKRDTSGLPPSWMPPPVTLSAQPAQRQSATTPAAKPPPSTPAPAPQVTEPFPPLVSRQEKDVSGAPPAWMPPPVSLSEPAERTAPDDDWKMSDPGPLPERRGRRLWLWIPLAVIALVLIICIAFFIWSATIGEGTVNRWATEAAVSQTEKASSGGN